MRCGKKIAPLGIFGSSFSFPSDSRLKRAYPAWFLLFATVFLASTYFLHSEMGFIGDIYEVNFLHTQFVFNMLWAKKLLLWNPFAFNGDVWLGQPLVGLFYPINWLVTLLFRGYSLNAFFLSCWVTIFFYFLGLYYLFRSLRLPRVSALVSSILCQPIFIPYLHGGDRHIAGMATVWLLGSFISFLRTTKTPHLILFVLSFFCFLSAYPAFYSHILLFAGVFLPLYLSFHLRPDPENLKRFLALSGISVFAALGFSGVQLVPTLEKLLSMGRVIPIRFIVNSAGGYSGVSWQDLSHVFFKPDYPLYWGPLVLACLALSAFYPRKLRYYRTVFAALVTLTFLVSFIRMGWVFQFLYRYLPLFQKIRQIYQIQIYLGLSLSIACAFLIHNFICTLRKKDLLYRILLFCGMGAALWEVFRLGQITSGLLYSSVALLAIVVSIWKVRNQAARSLLLLGITLVSLLQTQQNLVALVPKAQNAAHSFHFESLLDELKTGIHPAPHLPLKGQNYRKVSPFCIWHQWYVNDASTSLHPPTEMKQNIITLDSRSLELPHLQMTTLVFLPSQSKSHFSFYFDVKNGKNISLLEQVFSFYPRAALVKDSIAALNDPNSNPYNTLFLEEAPPTPQASSLVSAGELPKLPAFKPFQTKEIRVRQDPASSVLNFKILKNPLQADDSSGKGMVVRLSARVHKSEEIDYASNLDLVFTERGSVMTSLVFHPEQDGRWHDYTFHLGARNFDEVTANFSGQAVDQFEVKDLSYALIENYDSILSNVEIDATRLSVDVNAQKEGFVLLSDLFHSSWIAKVDDSFTPIFKGFGRFKSVYIPAGKHHVEFVFQPYRYLVGLFLTLMTICGFLAFFGFNQRFLVQKRLQEFRLKWR